MFETAFTLGMTQFARSLSLPERLHKRPFRNVALEMWRSRNTGIDALFYDVKLLTTEESFYISDSLSAEGMIMIVPPSGEGMLSLCDTLEEYVLRGGRDIQALALAGLGSSAIGAAAFARNVANAIQAPVATVVSGYGLGDVLTESMGGLFFYGPLGFLRQNFEAIDDVVGRPYFGITPLAETEKQHRHCLDMETVKAMLTHEALHFSLLVGHSRGAHCIAHALSNIAEKGTLAKLAKTKVFAFGTRIACPPGMEEAHCLMGELDWYGELNALTSTTPETRISFAGHSTNTALPGALKVTELLKEALRAASNPQMRERAAKDIIEERVEELAPIIATEPLPATPPVIALLEVKAELDPKLPEAEIPTVGASQTETEEPAQILTAKAQADVIHDRPDNVPNDIAGADATPKEAPKTGKRVKNLIPRRNPRRK